MRIENSHRLFYRLHILEKASGNKNGRARNAQPFYNSQVHSPWLLPRRFAGALAFGLLFDESIVCPEALRITIAGIHEFDIMADHAHNAET